MTHKEWVAKRLSIKVLLSDLEELSSGCGNQSCRVWKRGGMGTNGGCKCYANIAEIAFRLATVADEIKNIVHIPEKA